MSLKYGVGKQREGVEIMDISKLTVKIPDAVTEKLSEIGELAGKLSKAITELEGEIEWKV